MSITPPEGTSGPNLIFSFTDPVKGLETVLPPDRGGQPVVTRIELGKRAYFITFSSSLKVAYNRVKIDGVAYDFPFDVVPTGACRSVEWFESHILAHGAPQSVCKIADEVFPIGTKLPKFPPDQRYMLKETGMEPSTIDLQTYQAMPADDAKGWRMAYRWLFGQLEKLRVLSTPQGQEWGKKRMDELFKDPKITPAKAWNTAISERNNIVAYYLAQSYRQQQAETERITAMLRQVTNDKLNSVTANDVRMVKAALERKTTGASISGSARDAFRADAASGRALLPEEFTPEQQARMLDRTKYHRVYDPKEKGNSRKLDDDTRALIASRLDEEWKKNAAVCKHMFGYGGKEEDLEEPRPPRPAVLYYNAKYVEFDKLRDLQTECKKYGSIPKRYAKRQKNPDVYVPMDDHEPYLNRVDCQCFYPNLATNGLLPYTRTPAQDAKIDAKLKEPTEEAWKASFQQNAKSAGDDDIDAKLFEKHDADGDDDIDVAAAAAGASATAATKAKKKPGPKAKPKTMPTTTEARVAALDKWLKTERKKVEKAKQIHGVRGKLHPTQGYILLLDDGRCEKFPTMEAMVAHWHKDHPLMEGPAAEATVGGGDEIDRAAPADKPAVKTAESPVKKQRPAAAAAAAAMVDEGEGDDVVEVKRSTSKTNKNKNKNKKKKKRALGDDDDDDGGKVDERYPQESDDDDGDGFLVNDVDVDDDVVADVQFDLEAALTHASVDDPVERKRLAIELEQFIESKEFRRDPLSAFAQLLEKRGECKLTAAARYVTDTAEAHHDDDKSTTDEDCDDQIPDTAISKKIRAFNPDEVDYGFILSALSPTEAASKRPKIEKLIRSKEFIRDPEVAIGGILANLANADVSGFVSAIKTKYYDEPNEAVWIEGHAEAAEKLGLSDDESTAAAGSQSRVQKRKAPEPPSDSTPRRKPPAAAAAAAAAPAPAGEAAKPVTSTEPAAKRPRVDVEIYDPVDPKHLDSKWYAQRVRDADKLVFWFTVTRQPVPHFRYVNIPDEHYEVVAKRFSKREHATLYNRYECGILDVDDNAQYIGADPTEALAKWEAANRSSATVVSTRVVLECGTQKLSAKTLFLKEWDRLVDRVFTFVKVPKNTLVLSRQPFNALCVPTSVAPTLAQRVKDEAGSDDKSKRAAACMSIAHNWLAKRLEELHVRIDVRNALISMLVDEIANDKFVGWGGVKRVYDEFYELNHRTTERISVCTQAEYEAMFLVGYRHWPSVWHMYVYLKASPTSGIPQTPAAVAAAAASAAASSATATAAAAISSSEDLTNGIDVARTYSGVEVKALLETERKNFVASLATITVCNICETVDKINHNLYTACGHSYCTDCVAQYDSTKGIENGHHCPHCRTISKGTLLKDDTKERLVRALYHRSDWRRTKTTAELSRASDDAANTEAAKREALKFVQESRAKFLKADKNMLGFPIGGINRSSLYVVLSGLHDTNISADIHQPIQGGQPVLRFRRAVTSVFGAVGAAASAAAK